MTNKVLITGVNGFVGSHLLDLLVRQKGKGDGEIELFGTIRESSTFENIQHNRSEVELVTCDLVEKQSVLCLIEDIEPDQVYHLAGQSSVKESWNRSFSLVNNNVLGTLNILEALRQNDKVDTRILLACSSEEYGLVSEEAIPVDESVPLHPVSPYAVTKATVDMFGFQYYKSHGVKTIRTRAFNHTGPRRPETYALSDFAKQIVSMEKNGEGESAIHVGNLNAVRDYSDVRDIVRGYQMAMENCEPGEVYNICSERGFAIHELLDRLIELSGTDISIVQDDSRMRPIDVPKLIGDCSKFKQATGWRSRYSIDETLNALLEYWRNNL